jgi:tripartite-type tricarboxylate transporter receptor subunit TctC
VVPAGTPKDVIDKLNADTRKAMALPEFQKRMTDLGYELMGTTPAEMGELLQGELKRWGPVVKASGARAE